MKKKESSFEDALAALGAATTPSSRLLRGLNNLDPDQLTELQSAWPHLSANRRAYVVEKLREMAEADIELDFTPIFYFTLSDVEEAVRLSSIEGLWEDENLRLIDPLLALLRSDPSRLVRAASATTLGRFLLLGEMDKISRPRRDQVYSALMGALLSTPPGSVIYQHALESLAYAPNEEVEQLIQEAYASDNEALRVTAVFAMGRSSDRQYSEIVRKELHNVLPAMRLEAARSAGELEISEAIPDLGKLLEDPDSEVILAAVTALGQIGGDNARQLLQRAAESDDDEVVEAAEEALAEDEFLHGELKYSPDLFDEISKGSVESTEQGE